MEYYPESGAAFREHWFAPGPVEVRAASWENWPNSGPLFVGDFPGTVRCAPLGMFGRGSTEGSWLHLIHDDSRHGQGPRASRDRVAIGGLVLPWLGDTPCGRIQAIWTSIATPTSGIMALRCSAPWICRPWGAGWPTATMVARRRTPFWLRQAVPAWAEPLTGLPWIRRRRASRMCRNGLSSLA